MELSEKILANHAKNYTKTVDRDEKSLYFLSLNGYEAINAMMEFGKLHVQAALEAAAEKAKVVMTTSCHDHTPYQGPCQTCGSLYTHDIPSEVVDKDSILTAYPLENIK